MNERYLMDARERIPQRHIDTTDGHADKPLRTQQSKTRGEFVCDRGWRERLSLNELLEICYELSERPERRRRVGKDDAVAGDVFTCQDVDEDQRRFGDDAACSSMGLSHRHTD